MKTSLLMVGLTVLAVAPFASAKSKLSLKPKLQPQQQAQRMAPGFDLACYEPGNVRVIRFEQDMWTTPNDGGPYLGGSASLLIVDQTGSEDKFHTGERLEAGTYTLSTDGVTMTIEVPSRGVSIKCSPNGESIPMPSFGGSN